MITLNVVSLLSKHQGESDAHSLCSASVGFLHLLSVCADMRVPECFKVDFFLSWMWESCRTKAYRFRQTDVPLQIAISAKNTAARAKLSPAITLPLQSGPRE